MMEQSKKKFDYGQIMMELTDKLATVVFIKKNGDLRVMLGTRSLRTVEVAIGQHMGSVLSAHDGRCGPHNGNISVIDLTKDEVRSFNVDRVLDIEFYDPITTKEEFNAIYTKHKQFEKAYMTITNLVRDPDKDADYYRYVAAEVFNVGYTDVTEEMCLAVKRYGTTVMDKYGENGVLLKSMAELEDGSNGVLVDSDEFFK